MLAGFELAIIVSTPFFGTYVSRPIPKRPKPLSLVLFLVYHISLCPLLNVITKNKWLFKHNINYILKKEGMITLQLTQLGPRFTYIAGLVTSGSCAVLLG